MKTVCRFLSVPCFLFLNAVAAFSATNHLSYDSVAYISATSPLSTNGATLPAASVPFSDRFVASPTAAAGYSGPQFYAGCGRGTGSGASNISAWDLADITGTAGDAPTVQITAGIGDTYYPVFVFDRSAFVIPGGNDYRELLADLTDTTASITLWGKCNTAGAATAQIILQDGTGAYFIRTTPTAVTTSAAAIANVATPIPTTGWSSFDPYHPEVIGAGAAPMLSRIFAVGVRFTITSGASPITVNLHKLKAAAKVETLSNVAVDTATFVGLKGSGVSPSRINLEWQPISGAVRYEIQRSLDNTTFGKIGESAVNAFEDYYLSPGTAYYYKVLSYFAGGTSATSNNLKVATESGEAADNSNISHARHPSVLITAKEISHLKDRAALDASGNALHAPWGAWYKRMKARVTANSAKDPHSFDENSAAFINCKERGDAVMALATVWLVEATPSALAALKTYFENMPAPASLAGEFPVISYQDEIITPHTSFGQKLSPCYYESSLYISYATWGYAMAYDMVYGDLTADERARFASKMKRHARAIYDGVPANPSVAYKEYIDYKANNWVDVMAAGLATVGAVMRDYDEGGIKWGSLFLAKAYEKYAGASPAENTGTMTSNVHIKGGGAFVEGETYSAFTGYWTSNGLHSLRAVSFGAKNLMRPAAGEPLYYSNWLRYRLKNYTLAGRVPFFEAGRDTGSDAQRWMRGNVFDLPDATAQSQMLWLLDSYYSLTTDMDAPLFRYVSGPTAATTTVIKATPVVSSYVDKDAGLAFFRRTANSGNLAGDDSKTVVLTTTNRPFAGTLSNPQYNPSVTDSTQPEYWPRIALSHCRDDAGSFEIWAYGAYASNEPGYNTVGDADSASHATWVAQQAEAHNAVSFLTAANPTGTSPNRFVPSNGFQTWSTGHSLEFVTSVVRDPYSLKEADLSRQVNAAGEVDSGIGNSPIPLPSPDGSLTRTLLFVTPGTQPGYFVVFDDVTSVATSTEVRSHVHGMGAQWLTPPPAANLTVSGQTATWTTISTLKNPNALPTSPTMPTVNTRVYRAVPHVSSGNVFQPLQSKTYPEYWTGSSITTSAYNSDYTYTSSSGATGHLFVTVLYPYQTGTGTPVIADLTNTASEYVGAVVGSSGNDAAATLVSGTTQTAGGITSNGLHFFGRKNGAALDCYFADDASSLIYGSYGFSASGGQKVDITMDRYDATATVKKLRGTVAYTSAGTWNLTLKDAGQPAVGGTVTLTALDGTVLTPTPTFPQAGWITIPMPSAPSSTQYEVEVSYP